jgi:NADH-quinone oxidoreductase subunit M
VFVAGAFGYMGLPLMSGFAAEFFIFVGSFGAFDGSVIFTATAMFGIVIVAGYLLWAMQRVLFGPFESDTDYEVVPAAAHDVAPLVTLLAIIILLGVAPDLVYTMIQEAVNPIATATGGAF